jgi:Zn-dependent protease
MIIGIVEIMVRAKEKKGMEKSYIFEDWRDTIIAIVLLTVIFAYNYRNPLSTGDYIMPALLAIGVALLVNKIAHKIAAGKFGCAAYYKIWLPGVVFGLLLMLIGFKFPVVGLIIIQPFAFGRWVMKTRRMTMTEEGLNGLVGPLSNIMLAALLKMIPGSLFSYMAFVSAYFAISNLIPFKGFDGYRIMYWKPWIWLFVLIINLLLFFV